MRRLDDLFLFPLLFSFLLIYPTVVVNCGKTPTKEEIKAQQFPPCAACRILINSFKKGLDRTKREKFDGGDSAWEQDKLGSYSTSETRLIEIQENLCKEVDHGQAQCHSLAEELEAKIEDWWFNRQQEHPDIYEFVCVLEAKRCCPKDRFGPNCMPCLGYPDNVCNNNGKCKGAGTRKGNGECVCDKGYAGNECSTCDRGFYQSYKDEDKLLCSACHSACEGGCTGSGPKSCEKCQQGWRFLDGQGCVDIDECINSDRVCPGNQFCINHDGGHKCISCDKACNGCMGDGPDMCIKCAEGHHKKDNLCLHSDILGYKQQENYARYATYFGLSVATCIVFQRNIYIASIIGLFVGAYISVSEYLIAQDTTPSMDVLESS